MKKTFILAAILLSLPTFGQQKASVNETEDFSNQKLDSVVVSAFRAGAKTPVAFTEIGKNQMRISSPSASIPMILGLMPSVVATTEGGTGLGYSKLRVRGADPTRTNVTINGLVLNNPESQEVFWVNLPDMAGMLESIQFQRGVGTSVNGPGAFGASINMQTILPRENPYARIDLSGGSYLTGLAGISAGTGRMRHGFFADMRYAYNTTDGYIRNAYARLHSLIVSSGWSDERNLFKINYIFGTQHTGITWEGISREMLEKDRRYNPAGEYYDKDGKIQYYDNESDNYTQHNIQGLYTFQITPKLFWNTSVYYTKGDGFYENYKTKKKFKSYGLSDQIVNGVTYKKSDIIVRQIMDNGYIGTSTNLKYADGINSITGNASYSFYDGDHFGRILWAEYNNSIPEKYQWYFNNGKKHDFTAFLRGESMLLKGFNLYADIQYRFIDYRLNGKDKDFTLIEKNFKYNFLNPKAGFYFIFENSHNIYASLSVGHKEPSRDDIKDAIRGGKPDDIKSEKLYDWELGYRYTGISFSASANIYLMEYDNQLVPTGKLSSTGYKIKENVKNSYRRGIELVGAWKAASWLKFDANLTLSRNKILDYTAWVDVYDNPKNFNNMPQVKEYFEKTNIMLSPNTVGMGMVTFYPIKNLSLSLSGKYVGKQYYDNTSSNQRSIDAYNIFSFSGNYDLGKVKLSIFADNLFNKKYVSDAWVYRAHFADGSAPYLEEGFFPQPGINAILRLTYEF